MPESFFLLKFALKVSILPLNLIVLILPLLYLLPDSNLTLGEGLVEVVVLLLELLQLHLVVLGKLIS